MLSRDDDPECSLGAETEVDHGGQELKRKQSAGIFAKGEKKEADNAFGSSHVLSFCPLQKEIVLTKNLLKSILSHKY